MRQQDVRIHSQSIIITITTIIFFLQVEHKEQKSH